MTVDSFFRTDRESILGQHTHTGAMQLANEKIRLVLVTKRSKEAYGMNAEDWYVHGFDAAGKAHHGWESDFTIGESQEHTLPGLPEPVLPSPPPMVVKAKIPLLVSRTGAMTTGDFCCLAKGTSPEFEYAEPYALREDDERAGFTQVMVEVEVPVDELFQRSTLQGKLTSPVPILTEHVAE